MNERHDAFGRGMARALRVALWLGLAACARSHEPPGAQVALDAPDALVDANTEDAEREAGRQVDAALRAAGGDSDAEPVAADTTRAARGVELREEVRSSVRSNVVTVPARRASPRPSSAASTVVSSAASTVASSAASTVVSSRPASDPAAEPAAQGWAEETRLSRCAMLRSRPTWCREAWLEESP